MSLNSTLVSQIMGNHYLICL